MANRVIRDWTDSESVDELSVKAEVFFTRLIMKADDYGNYTGNARLINAALFPLKNYDVLSVIQWIDECEKNGLLFRFENNGKKYLHIPDFGQSLRRMKALYPSPTDDGSLRTSDGQVTDKRGQTTAETKRNETEDETETETKAVADETPLVTVWPSFDDFWQLYDKNNDKPKCLKKWEKIKQVAREKIMQHLALYVRATPDRQYRKNPQTYLTNESWNDEILIPNPNGKQLTSKSGKSNAADLAAALQERINQDARERQFQSSD